MQRRYPSLGFIAGLYQIAGALVMALGALALALALLGLFTPRVSSYGYGTAFSLAGLIPAGVAILSGIGLYAFGDLINLFRDMELNSRIAAENSATQVESTLRMVRLLEQLAARRRQAPPVSQPSQNPPRQ